MAASQPNKATINWVDSDEEGERPGWLEVGLRKVREQDAAERERKKKEEEEKKKEENEQMRKEYYAYQRRQERKIKEAAEKRQRDFEASWTKNWEMVRAKKEREAKIFRERVLHEARLAREAAEEEEFTSKRKDKGKGPASTQ